MHVNDIHLLFDYNYWATQLILDKATDLSEEQLKQPTDFSWGSLLGTLTHILDSEYVWRNICTQRRFSGRLVDQESFPTLASLTTYWEQEQQAMRTYLSNLKDDDMGGVLQYDIPEGVRRRILWHCLVHVVNHGTQHRSECAVMLTNFGKSPGDIDFSRYMNTQPAP